MSVFKKNEEITAGNQGDADRKIHINIKDGSSKGINVNVPLDFVKKMAKMGNGISGIVGGGALDSVKLEEILRLAESGVTGEILNITADDGATVTISVD